MPRTSMFTALALLCAAHPAIAQSTPEAYRDEFVEHFNRSSRKVVLLSRAIPDHLYSWSPGEGVMSIARVYMHIARYNYLYLEQSLDVHAPPDVEWEHFESITDKATVVELLAQSVEHVKGAAARLRDEHLTRPTMLYGRTVAGWAVLFQLLAHMNEHVGQSVAYARMNGVVPPWSR